MSYNTAMNIIGDIKPIGKAKRTEAQLSDPGITYNENGATFNDSRYSYGGAFGFQDLIPFITLSQEKKNRSQAQRTNVFLTDPGITYSESGITYNDPLYTYGGFSEHDIVPFLNTLTTRKPRIRYISDEQGTVSLNLGMPMGLLLSLTYNSAQLD